MHPTLQLLERHQSELISSPVHWFDLPEQTTLLKSTDKQFNLNWCVNNDATIEDSPWPCGEQNVLFYPKAKDRLDWWLKTISTTFKKGQRLWVVGENNGGIKSLTKRLKDQFECHKVDSARHCALYEIAPLTTLTNQPSWSQYEYQSHTIFSLPGVFSAAKLDKGTEVLLSVLPELKGSILEFGGGCGVITTCLAQQKSTTSVTSVEIDLLAVRSSKKTLAENNLADKAQSIWSAGTTKLEQQRFDAIVSNPPFHKGIKTEYGPTEEFFAEVKDWLKPRGRFIWVANDFLNYQYLLEKSFSKITVLKQEKGFKVFEALK